jgi:hypothetical protein
MPVAAWITEADLIAAHPSTSYADGAAARAILVASEVLYNLSGRRWPGVHTDTVLPLCQHGRDDGYICGLPGTEIRLPGFPVIVRTAAAGPPAVAASPVVAFEGAAFINFEVLDRRWLRRTDGIRWPCQRLSGLVDPAALEVTYAWGRAPTEGGQVAAESLAHQIAMALTPNLVAECQLPARVTSITRQGVTMAVLDPLTFLNEGRTGLGDVDLWLASLRYGDRVAPGGVIVPGAAPRQVRRTPPGP